MRNESPDAEPELEPQEDSESDDEIIGVAFRWSLMVIAGLGAVVAAVAVARMGEQPEEKIVEKDVGEIEDEVTDVERLPAVTFTDVTTEAGIEFVHESGARGRKFLPETMGGGVAFLDYDGDGAQDLFFVNGREWQGSSDGDGGAAPGPGGGNRLYRGDGTGSFEDVSGAAGIAGDHYGMGVAVGDANGDGAVDLVITGVGGNRMYENRGDGTFEDVTELSGVAGDPGDWTTSAGFFDLEGDGDLDLFVCHYVEWSKEIDEELAYTLNGNDRAYGPPKNYAGTYSTLYRNLGDGTFEDVSEAAGIQVANRATGVPVGKALGVVFRDVEGDGDTDVLVANDTVANHLFVNQGDGTFVERGGRSGFALSGAGAATGAMGMDAADFRGDGKIGVCIGNFANEESSLYVKSARGLFFNDDSKGEGIGGPSRSVLSFGLFFFDYDLDGRLDILQVNGHLEESINEVQPSQHYLQSPQLFWNQGASARQCFTEVPPETAGDLSEKLVGRGSAYADVDGDGDLDVVIAQTGRAPLLLRNDQALGRNWLRVTLRQDGMNPSALGSTVRVTSGDRTMERYVTRTRSYLSQSELALTFGLGESAEVSAIEVTWPDGEVQDVPVPEELNRQLIVER